MPLLYETVVAAIRRGERAPVYVLAGEDGLQQREILAALRERVPDLGYTVLDGAQASPGEAVTALRTAGLAAGRLVVVDEPPWILPARRRGAGGASGPVDGAEGDGAGEAEPEGGPERPLLRYLDGPAPDAVLVLRTSGSLDRRRRLVRRAAERGVQVLTEAPRDATGWLRQRAAALGLTPDRPAMEVIVARLQGATCERIAMELAKLASYGDGLDARSLDLLLPPSREERVFDLIDAALLPGGGALEVAAALQAQGEPVPLLLFLLAKHLRTMVQVKDACLDGSRPDAAASRLGLHPFVARKALDHARRLPEQALIAAWDAVWAAEFGFKSGRLDPAAALDLALLGILAAVRG